MNKKVLQIYLFASGVISFLAAVCLFVRRDTFTGREFALINMSLLVLFIFIGIAFLGIMFWILIKPVTTFELPERFNDTRWVMMVFILLLLFFLESTQNIIYINKGITQINYVFSYYVDLLNFLQPFFYWGVVFSLQSFLTIAYLNKNNIREFFVRKMVLKWVWIFGVLIILWLGIGLTDFGYLSNTNNGEQINNIGRFMPLAKPLPGYQITLVLGFTLLLLAILQWFSKRKGKSDRYLQDTFWISTLIWLFAIAMWQSVPIESNSMIDIPPYQVDTVIPSSDAFYFDKEAYRFLAGEGFSDRSTHVMYSFFLSVLHLLAGDTYQDIIVLQTLVLALVPVLLYLLTKKIYSHFAGILTAGFYIFRERNGLLLGSELSGPLINKYLSENLALLCLVVFIYLVFLWVECPERRKYHPAIAGGVMGVSLLIRADYLAALLLVSLILAIPFQRKRKQYILGMMQIVLISTVIITPWMFRNYQKVGYFSLDKGNFITRRAINYLENIFGREEGLILSSAADDTQINAANLETSNTRFEAFVNHVGNSYHQSFLFLPNTHQPFYLIGGILYNQYVVDGQISGQAVKETYLNMYSKSVPYYWYNWNGKINLISLIPISFALGLISIGLILTWKRSSLQVLLLGGIFWAQILIWAYASYSGSRVTLAIEWIPLMFYAVGLSQVAGSILTVLGWQIESVISYSHFSGIDQADRSKRTYLKDFLVIISIAVLILVGLGPSLLEDRIPQRYTREKLTSLITGIRSIQVPSTLEQCLQSEQDGKVYRIDYGIALYPRFFDKEEAYVDTRGGSVPDSGTSRVHFYLVGTENIWVSIPAEGSEYVFPHASEVIVAGNIVNSTYTGRVNNGYINADQNYLKAFCMIILKSHEKRDIQRIIYCQGSVCDPDITD